MILPAGSRGLMGSSTEADCHGLNVPQYTHTPKVPVLEADLRVHMSVIFESQTLGCSKDSVRLGRGSHDAITALSEKKE